MCYYSTTLHSSKYRAAKEGEDHTIKADHGGHHHYATGDSDGKITCMRHGTEVHIAHFDFHPRMIANLDAFLQKTLRALRGKEVHGTFVEWQGMGHSADGIVVNGARIHFMWIAEGTKFYTGAKRISLETRLGVDDPSIVLDHREETPTVELAMARALGVCSITR